MAVDNVLFETVEDRPTTPDLAEVIDAAVISVTNGSYTAITNPLNRATHFKCYLNPTGTAQAFNVRLHGASGPVVIVASGGAFEFDTFQEMGEGDTLFEVQTATGTINAYIIATRPHLYPKDVV